MNYYNISQKPQLVHSELDWYQLKQILVELNFLNNKGFPIQKYVTDEQMYLDNWNGREVFASGEMMETLIHSVGKYISEFGVPEAKRQITFEEIKAKLHKKL
jgi:hypothetical protein